ncbi:MAG: histidinol dehydrogenase [Firmicutes bacterium]|jgi:histidinol dehydrogenase|nr:histidinol dehydrogenase [Bacillota bacterium]
MPLPVYNAEQYFETVKLSPLAGYEAEREQVRLIIDAVRRRGDAALREFAQRYDGVSLESFLVTEAEFAAAEAAVPAELKNALGQARDNIERFHRRQLASSWWEAGPGYIIGQRVKPLRSVGAYVPGGRAAYPSSVLMTVVPARVAGVEQIIVATPPGPEGKVNALTLLAARIAGATGVYKIGGAQAIAALAFGTESVPAVQKIVGPGNLYVTLAKQQLFGQVGIDALAGPSEVLIVADDGAKPAFIAADLLAQAEHDPLARPLLVTCSRRLAEAVKTELRRQLDGLPRREIAARALKEQGAVILVDTLAEAWPVVNRIAPEHLELHLADAWRYLDCIENAGAIFIGPYTPESLGDYWAGSNHVLPTGGAARYASPLGVADYMKISHVLSYTAEALREAAPSIEILAEAESLAGHARAVTIRGDENGAESQSGADNPGDGGKPGA